MGNIIHFLNTYGQNRGHCYYVKPVGLNTCDCWAVEWVECNSVISHRMFWFTSVSNGTLGMLGSHRRPLSAPADLSDRGNPDMKAAQPRISLPQRPFCGSLAPMSSGDGHRLGISEPFPSFPVPSQITAKNKAVEPGYKSVSLRIMCLKNIILKE